VAYLRLIWLASLSGSTELKNPEPAMPAGRAWVWQSQNTPWKAWADPLPSQANSEQDPLLQSSCHCDTLFLISEIVAFEVQEV
jgi:hypothetical protein